MEEILFSAALPYGLQATLRSVYTAASVVRDRMSIDTWRIINRIDSDFSAGDSREGRLSDWLASLDKLMISFAAFAGLAMESMSRGLAWRFLDIGRRIERGVAMVQLCRTSLCDSQPPPPNVLESVLEVADSAITYRRRYMTSLQVSAVADLLLADETNPRSLAFQLVRLQEHLTLLLARIIQGPARDCGDGGRKYRVCRRLVSVAGLSAGAQSARATSIRFWVPMLHFTLSICRPV